MSIIDEAISKIEKRWGFTDEDEDEKSMKDYVFIRENSLLKIISWNIYNFKITNLINNIM